MFKYYLFSILLLFYSCKETKNSESNTAISKNNIEFLQEAVIEQKTYGEIFNIARKFLYFDFCGGRLSENNPYHDSLFALMGTSEGYFEDIFIVDTFMINNISEIKKDTLYRVIVQFPNSILIDPIFNVYKKSKLIEDTLLVKNKKVISKNIGHISKKVIFKYLENEAIEKGWSKEKLDKIRNKLK